MELCHYTANLEVVLVEIVRKFISVLNSLRSTETFMEVSGASGNNRGAIKSVGPVLLSSLSSCLTGTAEYSSDCIGCLRFRSIVQLDVHILHFQIFTHVSKFIPIKVSTWKH